VDVKEIRFGESKREAYKWFEDAITKLLQTLRPIMYRDGFGFMKEPIWEYNPDGSFKNVSKFFSQAEIEGMISGKSSRQVACAIHNLTSSTLYNCFLMSKPAHLVGNEYLVAQQAHDDEQMERGIGFASLLFAKFAVLALELTASNELKEKDNFDKVFDYAIALPLAIAKLNFRSLGKLRALQGEDGFFNPQFFEISGKGTLCLSPLGQKKLQGLHIEAREETLGCPVTRAYFEGVPVLKTLFPWFRDIYKTLVFPEFLAYLNSDTGMEGQQGDNRVATP
jgi:hypothetical protein